MKHYQKNNGFTLIELLVVVLIIGILSAIALPQYNLAVKKTRLFRLLPMMKSIKQANQLFYMANGYYTNDISQWDISLPEGTTVDLFQGGKKAIITLPDGSVFEAVADAVEGAAHPRVQGHPKGISVRLHVFYGWDEWRCYPGGIEENWRLCKHLGCTGNMPSEGAGCPFSF